MSLQSVFAIEAAPVILAGVVRAKERTLVLVHAYVMSLDVFWIGEEFSAVGLWAGVFLLPGLATDRGAAQDC